MAPNLQPVFLDTAYVDALINTRDQWHEAAVRWERKLAAERRRLKTIEFVLVEIADGLATVKFRGQAAQVIAALQASPLVEIHPTSSELFTTALDLYRNRPDKDWGLTDCASLEFVARFISELKFEDIPGEVTCAPSGRCSTSSASPLWAAAGDWPTRSSGGL